MKTLRLGLTLLLSFICVSAFALNSATPVGYWKQINDKNNQLQSIIHIWSSKGELYGKVLKGFPQNGKPLITTCVDCSGRFTNKKIVDMQLLWGFKKERSANEWVGGRIIDPTSGDIYRCILEPKDHGAKLHVHGYIGIPLFGRTQTWYRITTKKQLAHYLNMEN